MLFPPSQLWVMVRMQTIKAECLLSILSLTFQKWCAVHQEKQPTKTNKNVRTVNTPDKLTMKYIHDVCEIILSCCGVRTNIAHWATFPYWMEAQYHNFMPTNAEKTEAKPKPEHDDASALTAGLHFIPGLYVTANG